MGFKAITKNAPAEELPHILSEDDAAIYRGILGQDGVLNIGSKLKSTVLSNNKVRVGDGVINVDGHMGRNAYADYEDMTIENGAADKKRHDLIVASFSTTGSGGLDTYVLKVKKGTAGTTGTDPDVTEQDIYAGGKLREYPLYRVKLDGLSITGVDQLFKVIPTVPELEGKVDELNSALKNLYPVGSIYLSTVNKNPSEYFGGTWVQWGAGRVPVGVSADAEFNSVEKTGGAKTVTHAHETKGHTLTLNEIPSHTHYSGERLGFAGQSGSSAYSYNFEHYATGQSKKSLEWTRSGGNGSHSHGNTYDSANSVLQPYITCYMWKRTA